MSYLDSTRDNLAKRIAGEIVFSTQPGQTMRKWRTLLNVSQAEVSAALQLSPSVVSDYETGRRKSPGSLFIKKYVEALLEIDESRGGGYVKQLSRITFDPSEVFTDLKEFMTPLSIMDIVESIEGRVYTGEDQLHQDVYGYTVVDSVKAITVLSGLDFYRIFGASSEKAPVLTKVSRGSSTMITLKISPFKPRVVVLHGLKGKLDQLAIQLAAQENIPLVVSQLPNEEILIEALKELYLSTL